MPAAALVARAGVHLEHGGTEQACAGHQAVDHTDGTREAVFRTRIGFARFRPCGLRCVVESDERGRDFDIGA